jgi:hypothetical protein
VHFHLPKPLHGWRAFVGEVGIIVVGVLIALAAEQVVESWRWKADVAQARESLGQQLAYSKFDSLERLKNSRCIERKLDRLDDLITASARPKVVKVDLAPLRLWGTSSWDSATASGAVAHMRSDERGLYADLFTFTAVLGELNRKEDDLIGEVHLLDRPRALRDGVRDRLVEDIARLRNYNRLLALGGKQWLQRAEPLHLAVPDDLRVQLDERSTCTMPDDPAAATRD